MDRFDCMKFVVINGNAVQVVIWRGNEVPDGLIPLDGRIVNGITLPDHRDKVLYTKSEDSDEALVILRECISRRDLLEVMNDRVF
jgi:hypothetical protein